MMSAVQLLNSVSWPEVASEVAPVPRECDFEREVLAHLSGLSSRKESTSGGEPRRAARSDGRRG
jgi:hypothetical protein